MGSSSLLDKSIENKITAEWAEKNNYFNAAISRFYYCAFQKIIYISKKNKFYEDINNKKLNHEQTITCLTKHFKDKLSNEEISNILKMKKLRKVRNKADYHEHNYNQNSYNLSFKYYFNMVLNELDKLC